MFHAREVVPSGVSRASHRLNASQRRTSQCSRQFRCKPWIRAGPFPCVPPTAVIPHNGGGFVSRVPLAKGGQRDTVTTSGLGPGIPCSRLCAPLFCPSRLHTAVVGEISCPAHMYRRCISAVLSLSLSSRERRSVADCAAFQHSYVNAGGVYRSTVCQTVCAALRTLRSSERAGGGRISPPLSHVSKGGRRRCGRRVAG